MIGWRLGAEAEFEAGRVTKRDQKIETRVPIQSTFPSGFSMKG